MKPTGSNWNFRHLIVFIAAAWLLCNASPAFAQQDDVVGKALRDEMARSMEKLQLAKLDRPYFIAFRFVETEGLSATAQLGSLLMSNDPARSRLLTVELRVGDYNFDNTNFGMTPFFAMGMVTVFGGTVQLPLDDNYDEIRRQIWLATDSAYKQAVEQIAGKRAALQNVTQTEKLTDFSKEDVTNTTDDHPRVALNRASLEAMARELSAVFRGMSNIYSSDVEVGISLQHVRYINSEGSSYVQNTSSSQFKARAETQAADGMTLADTTKFYGHTMEDLPSKQDLTARIRELCARLVSLRDAPVISRYNGPVLFEGAAAAEIFNQVFAPALVAKRAGVGGSAQVEAMMSQMTSGGGGSLQERIGSRVLPDWMSVVDNPTLSEYGGGRLFVSYKVDDDAVRARETKLVDGGILKALLNGRTPVQGISRSTGNRRSLTIAPSNLILRSEKPFPPGELRQEFLRQIKKRGIPFGILVRRIGDSSGISMTDMFATVMASMRGGAGARGKSVLVAYKVFPDGHEELIRGAELMGLSVESFKDILAAGNETSVYTTTFSMSSGLPFDIGSLTGMGPVSSFVIPSLLFEDLTLSRPPQELPKLPFSAPPPIAP